MKWRSQAELGGPTQTQCLCVLGLSTDMFSLCAGTMAPGYLSALAFCVPCSSVCYMTSLRLHALGEVSLPQREMPEEANTGINQQKYIPQPSIMAHALHLAC